MKKHFKGKYKIEHQILDTESPSVTFFQNIPKTKGSVNRDSQQHFDQQSKRRLETGESSQKVKPNLEQQKSSTSIKLERMHSRKLTSRMQFKREVKDFFEKTKNIIGSGGSGAHVGSLLNHQNLELPPRYFTLEKKTKYKGLENANKLFQNTNVLSQIVKKQKIAVLTQNFTQKLKRNNINSTPIAEDYFEQHKSDKVLERVGFELNPIFDIIFSFISIIQILALSFIYTLSLVYIQVYNSSVLRNLQIFSLIVYLVEVIINLTTFQSQSGKKITKFSEIFRYYLRNTFAFDLINIFILCFDIFTHYTVFGYFRLLIILKMPTEFDKLYKLEVYFIKNFYNEQYWSLAKVFIFNFCFAHVLAIFLSAMASINTNQNWMVTKQINNSVWFERYIWSYYWGTTIMLTVGFGDLVATTYLEALCLIFIETFSCVALAYNINCVGALIGNIRSADVEKGQKLKILKKLTDKNRINEQLTWKINNYISQNSNIQKKFDFGAEKHFIQKLPKALRIEYLKDSNKRIFQNLTFFKTLVDRTLFKLAQKIQQKISHPQQIIKQIDDDFNLLILKQGQIGLFCKKSDSALNGKIIDVIKITQKDNPYLTSLDFITKKRPTYQIKSLEYSVLYEIESNDLIETFKVTDIDHELFSMLRDKIKNIPDEFQVRSCQICDKKHYKFDCPKLHYIPFITKVIFKNIYFQRHVKNKRMRHIRSKDITFDALDIYRYMKTDKPKQQFTLSVRRKTSCFQSTQNLIRTQQTYDYDDNNALRRPTYSFKQAEDDNIKRIKDILKDELSHFQKSKEFIDRVWLINLDCMQNYNSYFPQDNPNHLSVKFSIISVKPEQMTLKSTKFEDEEVSSGN